MPLPPFKNPNFQKAIGADRAEGTQMLAAERKASRTMQGGSKLGAGVGIQNTKHGKLDLPVAALNKYAGHKQGGLMESKKMVQKEVAFMEKKGAPKSMLKHEKAEAKGMKFAKGGSIMRPKKDIAKDQMAMAPFAKGGSTGYQGRGVLENKVSASNNTAGENPKVQKRGLTEGRVIKMATGGIVKFAKGGGIEVRGKTRGKMC